MRGTICDEGESALVTEKKPGDLAEEVVLSPVLARLIEEVRIEKAEGPHAYNRMHNRHNRSR